MFVSVPFAANEFGPSTKVGCHEPIPLGIMDSADASQVLYFSGNRRR